MKRRSPSRIIGAISRNDDWHSTNGALHRYILNVSIMDHTGHIWVTAFNEIGEAILGKDANEMTALKV